MLTNILRTAPSALRIVLLALVNINFSMINLGAQVSQHALYAALLGVLHLLVIVARVRDDIL